MSTLIRSALIAVAVLSSVSAVSARSLLEENGVINSQRDLNDPEAVKEFWESQQDSGN